MSRNSKEEIIVKWSVPVFLKNQGGELERITDVASSIKARDYKGFENFRSTGVLVC